MSDNAATWKLIHSERVALANTLEGLSPEQWVAPSQCTGWSIQLAAAHVLAGAEQTGPRFMAGMMASGFRFNAMVGRDVSRLGGLGPQELVERLRARTTTTNHPPAPVMAMLGEVVVHGEDIRRPLGLSAEPSAAATLACLDMFKRANFPVGAKKRISGLRLVATDADWDHGAGPELQGPMLSLLLAMTGRASGLEGLSGEGATVLSSRL
jgi:uncharacterized protein (TIGR03083 family)